MTVLRTKLTPPRLRPSLTRRPRLLAQLNSGLSGDVTLVSAPAGYGKTTLVADWAEQAPLPVAWLSLDEGDNELASFLSYFVSAIRTIFPEACPTVLALAERPQLGEGDLLPTILVNEIDDLPQRFALVLDDYHAITRPAVHGLLDSILRRPSTQLHLLILSRTEPPLALGRLRATGMLAELGSRDLRFTPAEAESLVGRMPRSLNEQDSAKLMERSEGWVTGLHLASMTLHSAADPPALVETMLADNNRYVIDYLFEQVLDQQSPEVREFLAKTAILDRLSPPLARAVVGPGAAMPTTLVEIERAGLFLNALDNRGEWFVYHALFHQALQKLLHETHTPEEIATLHRRASQWYAQHNLVDEALRHALASGDQQMAARIVSARVVTYLNGEGWPTLEQWLNQLSGEVIDQQPLLLVAKAYVLTYRIKWDAVTPFLHKAQALLASEDSESEQHALATALMAWVWAYHWVSEMVPEKARAAAEQALAALPDNYPATAYSIIHILSVTLQWLGEMEAAEAMINESLAGIPPDLVNSANALSPLFALTTLYLAEGFLVQGEEAAEVLLQKANQVNAPLMKVWAYLSLAVAAYHANDLSKALGYFSEGIQLRYNNILAGNQSLVGMALTYQALGQTDEARGVLAILRDFHRELANPLLSQGYRSLQAQLALLSGDISMARQWSSDTATDEGLALGWFIVPAITNIHVKLADEPATSDLKHVLAELDRLLAQLEHLRQPRRQVELLSLKAATLGALGNKQTALETLRVAITLAEPRGLIRPIIEAGPHLEPLLTEMATAQAAPFVTRLQANLRQAQTDVPDQLLSAPRLTAREQEVLILLSQYQTDRAIAETLVVSPLTVRTHIKNLAEKLSVRGRRKIVDRARSLGLLP